MKLLLDENLPHDFRHELIGHDCYTVAYMGWGGVDNGALLTRAASEGFDALITNDANLQYQQNRQALPVAVIVLNTASNDMDDLLPVVPRLLAFIPTTQARSVNVVPPS